MEFDMIINTILNNGMGVGLLIYFVYKDNKFNTAITNVLQEIREVLTILKERNGING